MEGEGVTAIVKKVTPEELATLAEELDECRETLKTWTERVEDTRRNQTVAQCNFHNARTAFEKGVATFKEQQGIEEEKQHNVSET
jgi:predicted  nucleic acid-binding Zn-ribbon protein